MFSKMLKYYLFLFSMCFLLKHSLAQEEQHPIDGWAYSYKVFNPELHVSGGSFFAVGAGGSFTVGQMYGDIKFRNLSAELGLAAQYWLWPEPVTDIDMQLGVNMGLPVYAGISYYYLSHRKKVSQSGMGFSVGYSRRTPYTSVSAGQKVLFSYRFPIKDSGMPEYAPWQLSLVYLFDFRKQ